LGAFLAGAIAGLLTSNDDHSEEEKLDAIGYGFFIPIFFIMVGARFNLEAVFSSTEGLILLLWLVGVAFAVKLGPALLLKLRFPWRKVMAGGMLLSPRLSLIIAASAIALDMGLISETVNSDVIMLAIITVAVAPFLFNRIFPEEERLVRSGVILVGQDQLAEYIVERLQHGDETVTVICPEQGQLETFGGLGAQVVDGCVGIDQALNEARAGQARVLLDLTPDSSETLEVCQLGKGKYDIPLVVSRISDVELIPKLQEMGIKVIHPELATAMALEGAIRYPSAFDVLIHQAKDIEVAEIKVTNHRYSGSSLAQITLPGDVIVLSLQRNSTVMIPHGDTVIEPNDLLGLIGRPGSVEEAIAMLKG
jgi:Trk K+ transport system NAD-binding subunit